VTAGEQHKRVLVVDDDASIRELLGSVLRGHSMIVDEAADGAEALELIRGNRYAVILLDLLMPVVDGFAVLEKLDATGDGSQPVVLVISGADRRTLDQLDSQRIHGVVRKPFDAEELAMLVVACSEVRGRANLGTMAIATMLAGGPILALLNRFNT